MDERFSLISRDQRFRPIRQSQRKVQIDKRFHGLFFNKSFQEKFTVDKRGRPLQESSAKNLRRFYHLSREERKRILKERQRERAERNKQLNGQDPEKTPKENIQSSSEEYDSDSSYLSSEEDDVDLARGKGNMESSSEDEDFEYDEDVTDHKWGEMDSTAPRSEDTSRRLALCGMDWDRIAAADIFVLLDSFKPTQGSIKTVTIYPSNFGVERMAEEERSGPAELKQMRTDENGCEWTKDNDEEYNTEKLREYQLNRLKYYYAVIELDSIDTAEKIYTECDGIEFEASAAKLDLRFIPDNMQFTDHPPKEVVNKMPDPLTYKPAPFITQALNLTKVGLTWDETDHKRTALTRSKISKEDLENLDVKAFLASGSESDEVDENPEDLHDVQSKMDEKERAEMYRKLLLGECNKDKEKDDDIDMEITWEPDLKMKAEEEINGVSNKKNNIKKSEDKELEESDQATAAELEMVLLSDDRTENENFELNVDDKRFSALYTSSKYAIDQSSASFKKSEGMEKFLDAKQSRLKRHSDAKDISENKLKKSKHNIDSVANLVKSVKQKSMRHAHKKGTSQ